MRTKVPLGRAEKTTGSNNNNDRGPQRQRNVFSRAVCLSLHLCRPASAHSHTSYVIHSYHIVHAGWEWLRLAAKQAHTYCILPIKMLDASDDCEQRKQPERVLRFSIKHRSNIYAPSRRRLSTQVRRTPIWFLYREFLYIYSLKLRRLHFCFCSAGSLFYDVKWWNILDSVCRSLFPLIKCAAFSWCRFKICFFCGYLSYWAA